MGKDTTPSPNKTKTIMDIVCSIENYRPRIALFNDQNLVRSPLLNLPLYGGIIFLASALYD
jgi:hypothetical protein